MKNLATIILLLLIQLSLSGQWQWQNPLPQGNDLNDVFFIDEDIGWAVGELGTIIKTSNSGVLFEVLESSVTANLNAVEFISPQCGFVVGDNGTILETINGGYTWNAIQIEPISNLTDICITQPNIIWVAGEGGTILYSNDSGNSFDSKYNDTTNTINSIYFLDTLNGWAAGNNDTLGSVVLFTNNGGNTWTELTGGILPFFSVIHFTDLITGWAIVNYGQLYKTTDGGLTWFLQLDDLSLNDIFFYDSDIGWAVGHGDYIPVTNTVILHTSDGGLTWEVQASETWYGLTSVYFVDNEIGCAVGVLGNIVSTETSGSVWNTVCGDDYWHVGLRDVFFTDINHGWTAGGPFLLNTSDGGKVWEEISVTTSDYKAIHFIDQSEGWIAGGATFTQENKVLHTDNGGSIWEIQYQHYGNYDSYTFKDIYFINSESGWIIGGSQHYNPPINTIFLQTDDGGETWDDISYLTENCLNAITFSDNLHGWIVGHETILQTADGGETWAEVWEGIHSLKDVFFIDTDYGWIIGDSLYGWEYGDVVMRTTDGGLNWEKQYFDYEFNKIYFTDFNTGYITVGNGVILSTTDGGINWEEQFVNSSADLYGIFFFDKDNGWLVGRNTTILYTDNGGAVGFKDKAPQQELLLHVNLYPNPSSTQITIELPTTPRKNTFMTIYNLNGKQLITQPLTEPQTVVDVSGLPKGVYFVKVVDDEKVMMGKMIKE